MVMFIFVLMLDGLYFIVFDGESVSICFNDFLVNVELIEVWGNYFIVLIVFVVINNWFSGYF